MCDSSKEYLYPERFRAESYYVENEIFLEVLTGASVQIGEMW